MYFEKILPDNWIGVRRNFQKIDSYLFGPISEPTFNSITLSGLTDDSLVYPVSGVLTSLGVAANGKIPIGSTGTTPVLAEITGTANQITSTPGAGSITLSLPDPLAVPGKVTAGSFGSPTDVTVGGQYGFELHYSGNNYNVTGVRSRAQLVTTDTTATALGGLFQAANNDNINAGVLMGFMAEAIGKSTANASTITTMRGGLIGTEWGALDTVTNLKTLHVRGHSRNAAGAGSFGTGYGLCIENEAVGGNGQAYDAGIYFKGTNLSAGNKAFTFGIDFSGGTYGTADMKMSDGGYITGASSLNQNTTTTGSPTFAGGTFTGVVTGVTPTAGTHLATKEYVDLALGARKDFFLSDTASGALLTSYPHETGGVSSTVVTAALAVGDDQLVRGFITEAGEPATTTLHEGVIGFHFHAKKGASNHRTTVLYAVLSWVDADGTSNKTTVATTEVSGELTAGELSYDIHAVLGADVEVASTARLILDVYANVSGISQDSVVTLYMEGADDSYFSTNVDSGIWQNHGDVLDDLNTVGPVTGDDYVLIGTAAGVLAWETGATLKTSLGLTIGTNVQAWDAELDKVTDGDHDVIASGNPHSVTPTELSLLIGTNTQAWDASLDSIAALTYASASFIKVTAEDTYAIRTIAETKSDLSLNLVENTALSTYISSLTAITTIDAAADYIPVLDATDSVHKKIKPTNLGHRFVDRGDPSVADWIETGSKAVLNTDGGWYDLDCSSIVPAGAVAIVFNLQVKDGAVGSNFRLRKNGNTNAIAVNGGRTQVIGVYCDYAVFASCDTDQVVEYQGSNLAFTTINLTILGWFV